MCSSNIEASRNATNNVVFVGGIPGRITSEEVQLYFSRFGPVSRVQIPPKKGNPEVNCGYCYVVFVEAEAKQRALSRRDHYLGSRRVSCKHFLKGAELSSEMSACISRKLFVKFVPGWVTEEAFRAFFAQFGELSSYYLVKFKDPSALPDVSPTAASSIGYLVYKERAASELVLSRQSFKLGGKKVLVEKYNKNFNRLVQENLAPTRESQANRPTTLHFYKPTETAYGQVRSTILVSEETNKAEGYRFNVGVQKLFRPFQDRPTNTTSSQPWARPTFRQGALDSQTSSERQLSFSARPGGASHNTGSPSSVTTDSSNSQTRQFQFRIKAVPQQPSDQHHPGPVYQSPSLTVPRISPYNFA